MQALAGVGRIGALLLALLAWGALTAGHTAGATSCKSPANGAEWKRVAPAKLGLDTRALNDALAFASAGGTNAAAVYRHGCLAATDAGAAATRSQRFESWSMAKSVVSLAAGRAMTLGLLSPDDPVGALIPEADKTHGAVTLRQLLEMASGLHWNFFRDYNITRTENRVHDALTLPFDHGPGTYFEYAQSPVALVAEMVGRSAGMDFQAFVQRHLFGPMGIAPGTWSWGRERFGNTLGFMGLQLRPGDYARVGHLMLGRGVWRGRRLLSEDYVELATSSSPNNPGYGWFWWVNAGRRFIGPTIEGRAAYAGRFVPSAPPDMFSAVGFMDQLVMVIPSVDLVITRSGGAGQGATGERGATGSQSFKHELVRRVMRAVESDPGPFKAPTLLVPRDPGYGIGHSATEAAHVAAAGNTPALPPAGPARARAVQVGATGVHASPLAVHGSVLLRCPPAGRGACLGTAEVAGKRLEFRIARGRGTRLRLPKGVRGRVTLRLRSRAKGGATVTQVPLRVRP